MQCVLHEVAAAMMRSSRAIYLGPQLTDTRNGIIPLAQITQVSWGLSHSGLKAADTQKIYNVMIVGQMLACGYGRPISATRVSSHEIDKKSKTSVQLRDTRK